jgi:hypothetical protein
MAASPHRTSWSLQQLPLWFGNGSGPHHSRRGESLWDNSLMDVGSFGAHPWGRYLAVDQTPSPPPRRESPDVGFGRTLLEASLVSTRRAGKAGGGSLYISLGCFGVGYGLG